MAGRQYNPNALRHQPEFHAWRAMVDRCTLPHHFKYKDYGARGIHVCADWAKSFNAFLRDVGRRPTELMPNGKRNTYSLDRHPNNDGNYEPGNVRWATWMEQNNNRRKRRAPKGAWESGRAPLSGYRGVRAIGNRWLAAFNKNHLGMFSTREDAATAYNFAAFEHYGDAAIFNLP